MMSEAELEPYEWRQAGDRFEVIDQSGRVVVVCRDKSTAQQHVVLLTEAFRRGYKAGRRTGAPTKRRYY